MPKPSCGRRAPLPKHWPRSVQAAILQVMSLAHFALVTTRSWATNSSNQRVRLAARVDQLEHEVRLLREECRIKDARLARISPAQRPHYLPTERLAILQLRAARGWSLAQTARVFHLTTPTIASWMNRLDEEGPKALLQTQPPVNKFPDFVRALVQRLHLLCPRLGKVKTAQILARAGLHLASSTVGRMRREPPAPQPIRSTQTMPSSRRVTARYPDHVWHVDLTTVPTSAGFWTSWSPLALPQCWPFCWWLAVIMDHFSRRVHGSGGIRTTTDGETGARYPPSWFVSRLGKAPRHLITDQGKQFSGEVFSGWCRERGIRQRFGAVGKQGSIAVVERMIRTVKQECTRALPVVSLRRRSLQRELQFFLNWYHADRPHTALKGATPDEIYYGTRPACRRPRFEPRPGWPRASRSVLGRLQFIPRRNHMRDWRSTMIQTGRSGIFILRRNKTTRVHALNYALLMGIRQHAARQGYGLL